MSITELLEENRKKQFGISGVIQGIVTNNKDPDGLGRVKVKIPRINADSESHWARVATFMGGKERGAFFLPEVDDEVLIAFEFGDVNVPYIIGSLWNGVDKPPVTNDDGKNDIRIIKSRSGHIIRLTDKDGEEKIEIQDKTGKNLIKIDSKENTITISSDKDILMSAKNGTLTIDAKNVVIKSSADTKTEAGAGIDLKASGTMNLKGSTVNIN